MEKTERNRPGSRRRPPKSLEQNGKPPRWPKQTQKPGSGKTQPGEKLGGAPDAKLATHSRAENMQQEWTEGKSFSSKNRMAKIEMNERNEDR
jgi:hypothetical protein